MKQVNLTEILSQFVLEVSGIKLITISAALQAMQEACNQAIDLCAENATTILHKSGKQIEVVTPVLEPQYYERGNGDLVPQGYAEIGIKRQLKYENELIIVDKQSILDTKKQII